MAWVREKDISGTEQIYFLADVVGSGKTALAHSIAQECSDCNLLASSFFFDCKVGRTNPRDFISNLARDLGSRFPEVSTYISLALRADPNLALSQPVSRLFKELILEPVIQSGIPGPIVVVIDALHEVETPEIQNILRTQITNLSGQFRVFVTSRPEHNVLRSLGPAITPHDLAIHKSANRADMNTYVTHKLEEIRSEHHELENWPDRQLVKTLLDRAEGLFIWIATICDYISHHIYPDKILEDLLKTMREFQLPPEEKMDALYSTIMAVCPWHDAYFVDGYQQVVGIMAVEKMPLTVDGLQKLHDSLPKSMLRVKAIVDKLASLITGSTSLNQPIQILHGSFREYITQRAPGNHRIFVEQHNAQLALTCLHILTKLPVEIIKFGYLNSSKGSGVPDMEIDFTEEQLYALEFWLAHITDCNFVNPPIGLKAALETFLHLSLQTWIEIITSKSKYQSLIPLRKRLPDELVPELSKFRLGPPLRRLLKRLLEDESRLGEVLLVMEDLKEMGESNWDTDSDSDGESSLELESITDSSDDGYRDASNSE
ncbi:hypothetical protein DFH08DRAFT_452942 [Mycena albidolilacea]|uniref:Nephrocystin 3-like N-terminal domain-containing protein n=1 Tax=Mycena albidolilacea TaxID=1033008 RepID=A0AAD7ECW6_9AGAR|nr:hypothetical protein DFH08DRAFT_452942 [Mycena albidolilacea]